ncbi:hypothetical protein Syun_003874 [Stephania yunnanensis]|uniref:Uncharacterized protein n=1 Tax=Stephania yunnanensis TaxID=152371 RepID=A0AAP0L1Y1_9MAGN
MSAPKLFLEGTPTAKINDHRRRQETDSDVAGSEQRNCRTADIRVDGVSDGAATEAEQLRWCVAARREQRGSGKETLGRSAAAPLPREAAGSPPGPPCTSFDEDPRELPDTAEEVVQLRHEGRVHGEVVARRRARRGSSASGLVVLAAAYGAAVAAGEARAGVVRCEIWCWAAGRRGELAGMADPAG